MTSHLLRTRGQTFWRALAHGDACTSRVLIATLAFGLGLVRVLALPSQSVNILSSQLYGALFMTVAVGLVTTLSSRHLWYGRAFAIVGAALFAAFVVDLWAVSPASAWISGVLMFFLLLEAAYVAH